jgi:hypothetical protein
MQELHTIWQYFTTLPASSWYGLLGILGTSAIVSGAIQVLKPKLKTLETKYGVEAKKLVIALLGLLSFAVSVAGDYVNSGGQSLGNVGNHAAWIMTLAVAVYHFGGSKAYASLTRYLKDLQAYLDTGQLPGNPKS